MTTKKLPLHVGTHFESIYGHLGVRLAALFLDWLFLSPVVVIVAIFNSMRLSNYYYTYLFAQVVILSYFMYLPVRYGATPGKRIMGLTILKIDGSAIHYRESFLKILPQFLIGLFTFALQCYLISLADEATFNNLSWMKQSQYLTSFMPYYLFIIMLVGNGFNVANLITFVTNERKQSIGDLAAGTVVVYTTFLEKIRENRI
jgi:uncharacterized RDD family membrane protein YckC